MQAQAFLERRKPRLVEIATSPELQATPTSASSSP